MSDYQRNTALPLSEVWKRAEEVFTTRIDLEPTEQSRHHRVYAGGEGTLTVEAHRHGPYTEVIARTDRLRTSKIDEVARHFLNQLAYQPGDPERE